MSRLVRIVIDVGVAGFFVALFLTREGPNYTPHSVIGLVAVAPILLHLWPNRRWIAKAWSRDGWARKLDMSRLNLVLAASTTICTFTGVTSWAGFSATDVPHTITGFVATGAAVVHGFRNRSRFRSLLVRTAR